MLPSLAMSDGRCLSGKALNSRLQVDRGLQCFGVFAVLPWDLRWIERCVLGKTKSGKERGMHRIWVSNKVLRQSFDLGGPGLCSIRD